MTDASSWPVCIVESPFRADSLAGIELNRLYAIKACQDCLRRQEVPYASHLLFPQMLDEMKPEEREAGLTAGYAMWWCARRIAFYVDRGWSPGMERALVRAKTKFFAIEYRSLENGNASISLVPSARLVHGDK